MYQGSPQMRMRGPACIAQSAVRGLPKSRAGVFSSLKRGELLLAASPFVSYNVPSVKIKIPYIKPGASRLTPSYVWGVRQNDCAKGADTSPAGAGNGLGACHHVDRDPGYGAAPTASRGPVALQCGQQSILRCLLRSPHTGHVCEEELSLRGNQTTSRNWLPCGDGEYGCLALTA
jgi:hypothetical protein